MDGRVYSCKTLDLTARILVYRHSKNLVEDKNMKRNWPSLIVVIGAMALLANLTAFAEEHHSKRGSTGPNKPTPTATPVGSNTKGGSTGPTKSSSSSHPTDLSGKIASMKLKEGNNVVHTDSNVKLVAVVKGGEITGYSATDSNGKSLVTTIERRKGGPKITPGSRCFSCVDDGKGNRLCYEVPCPKRMP